MVYQKAEVTTVKVGNIEIEGLMISDGSFGVSLPQICSLFQFPNKHASRDVNALLGDDFQFPKWRSTLHPKAVNVVPLAYYDKLVYRLAFKGNHFAQDLVEDMNGLSWHQLFCDAFGKKFDADDRHAFLKARQSGKRVRRTLTDAIKDYLLTHDMPKHYRKWIYAWATDKTYLAIFGRTCKQLQDDWNIGEDDTPRNHMIQSELKQVEYIEHLAMKLIDMDNLEPQRAVEEAASRLLIEVSDR